MYAAPADRLGYQESRPGRRKGRGGQGAMTAKQEPQAQAAKIRKTTEPKPAKRTTVPKVKTSITISVEAWQRLGIHATMMNIDRSELMEQLIRDHLKRYVVSDRGGTGGEETPLDEE